MTASTRSRMHLPMIVMILLSTAVVTTGQSRGQRRGGPVPGVQPVLDKGAGTASSPGAGYVVIPESAPAGEANEASIPTDSIDQAYWELFDSNKKVTISGRVSKVAWTNPNSYIYIQTNSGEWAVESAYVQFRQARVSPAVSVGQTITVSGFMPRDAMTNVPPAKLASTVSSYVRAKRFMRAGEITTVHGQKLKMGQPPSEKEAEEREDALRGLLTQQSKP